MSHDCCRYPSIGFGTSELPVTRCLAAVLALVLQFAGSLAFSAPGYEQRVLVMGAVHPDPQQRYGAMKPMAEYVARHLRSEGISDVEIVIVPNRRQMVNLLRDRRIDWLSETAFGAVYFASEANAEVLLRKWKGGAAQYRTVFFARKDSDIRTLADLENRTIAFEHKNSTSAYFLPAVILLSREYHLDALATPRELPQTNTIGYLFSGNDYNTAAWVTKGIVAAGALSNTAWASDDTVPRAFQQDLHIIYESKTLPRAIEVVRADLDPQLKVRLKTLLTTMHLDPAASLALAAYDRTAKFDALSSADNRGLGRIRNWLVAHPDYFQ